MKLEHLDEAGQVCTQHPANADRILTFAAIGARAAGFNHDVASKLQGMMMALDELDELLERAGTTELRRAAETARGALDEAHALLSASRALTRTSTRTTAQLRDIVTVACERAGVSARGDAPQGQVAVTPLLVQALGLAIEALAGTGSDRVVEVTASREGDRATLVFASPAAPTTTLGDALALASFVIAHANGELRCGRDHRLHVRLPLVG